MRYRKVGDSLGDRSDPNAGSDREQAETSEAADTALRFPVGVVQWLFIEYQFYMRASVGLPTGLPTQMRRKVYKQFKVGV